MNENPYEPPRTDEPSRLRDPPFLATLAAMLLASSFLGWLLAPADPVSVYLVTALIFGYSAAWYCLGRWQAAGRNAR